MTSISIVSAITDPMVDNLQTALVSQGLVVEMRAQLPTTPMPTVVVLTDELIAALGGVQAAETALQDLGANLIPVVASDKAFTDVLADRSQIPLASFGVDRAAGRIGLIARVGQEAIGSWNALHGRAHQWQAESEPISGLLRGDELVAAGNLLTQPVAELPDADRPIVVEYVAASRTRVRTVRRRAVIAVILALALVIGAGVAAVIGRAQSTAAAAVAMTSANQAEADRLATLSLNWLGRDPDLPWILSSKALSLARTPQAIAAARQVFDATIPHKTFFVDDPVTAITLLPNGFVAAGQAFGGGVSVLDVTTGTVALRQPGSSANGAATAVSANPSGTVLAVVEAANDGIAFLANTSDWSQTDITGPKPSFAPVWLDDEWGLAPGDGFLVQINATQARSRDIPSPSDWPGGAPSAWTVDGSDGWVAIASSNGVSVYQATKQADGWQLNDMASFTVSDVEQVRDVEVATISETTELIVLYKDKIDLIDVKSVITGQSSVDQATTSSGTVAFQGFAISQDGEAYAAVGNRAGSLDLHNGSIDYAVETSAPIAAVAAGAGGVWVTGGGDRAVRVWTKPAADGIGAKYSNALWLQGGFPGFKESLRNTLGSTPGTHLLTVVVPSVFTIMQIDMDTFTLEQSLGVDRANMAVRQKVAPANGQAIADIDNQVSPPQVSVIMLVGSTGSQEFRQDVSAFVASQSLFGLSPTGDALAVATNSELMLWPTDETSPIATSFTLPIAQQPVFVQALDQHHAVVVGQDGTATWIDGTTMRLFDNAVRLTAATIDPEGNIVTLDDQGNLIEHLTNGAVPIGTVDVSIGGYALKYSASGRYLAIIGSTGTTIVDTHDGAVAMIPPPRLVGSTNHYVDDVAFSDDESNLFTVTDDGFVQKYPLLSIDALAASLVAAQPRDLTAEEQTLFLPTR